MRISIDTNFGDISRRLDQLAANVREQAVVNAVNATIAEARKAMSEEIVAEYNVTPAYVRERLRINRAMARRGSVVVEASLLGSTKRGKGRSANLIAFLEKFVSLAQARKRSKTGDQNQLRFQIRRAGGQKILRGAFIGNKGRTVFRREGKERLPIKAISTIDVPSMFNQRFINGRVVDLINERFPQVFEVEARRLTDLFNQS